MADRARRNPNDRGEDWFVDTTCIDCDVARQLAPGLIEEDSEGLSYFARAPRDDTETRAAWRALLACPSGSIGGPRGQKPPPDAFPMPVAPDVFLAGYHAESSFGAHAYLARAAEGNFMVDAPRFVPPLVKAIADMGGIRHILLTHRDDVADYDKYARRFGARVWIHEADAAAAPEATDVFAEESEVQPGLVAIPFPGHTRGSALFHWRDRYLFTGDSLAFSRRTGDLQAFRDATWYSWKVLTSSMQSLMSRTFEWVLPGHGSVGRRDPKAMHESLDALARRMKNSGATPSW